VAEGGERLVKAGWRVRKAQARRRERLLQDFTGFPVQAGPGSGPGAEGAKTQQTCGLAQAVQVGQAAKTLPSKCEGGAREGQPQPVRGADVCPSHGSSKHQDHLDHPDQASNGAAFARSTRIPSGGPPGPAALPWADLDAWRTNFRSLTTVEERRVALREWVAAAGGWSDAAAVSLPSCLPAGLALATLKAEARGLRLDVREDHDDPEHLRWLQGQT
jgi:hypothetical protein